MIYFVDYLDAGYDFKHHEIGQTERHGGGFSILVGNFRHGQ